MSAQASGVLLRRDRAAAGQHAAQPVGRDQRRVGGDVDPLGLGHLADLLRQRHPAEQVGDPLRGRAGRRSGTPAATGCRRRPAGRPGRVPGSSPTARASGRATSGGAEGRARARGAQHRWFSLPDQEAGRPPWPDRAGLARASEPRKRRFIPVNAERSRIRRSISSTFRTNRPRLGGMAGSGRPSNGCAPPTSRAVIGPARRRGPDEPRRPGARQRLSRTTVSSLVAELIARRPGHRDRRPRPAAQGRQRPPAGAGRAQRAGRRRGRRRHRARPPPGRGRRPRRRGARRGRTPLVDVDAHGAEALDRAAAHGPRALPRRRASPRPTCRRSACACRRRWTGARRGSAPASCRAGRACCPARSWSGGSAYRCYADNDANLGALAELHHGVARGAHDVDLPEDRQRRRRRDRARRPAAPRRQRDRRRDRARPGRRGRPRLPLRQPRLPRDDGLGAAAARRCCEPAYDEPLTTEHVLELDADGDAGVRRVLSDAGRTVGRAVADLCNSLNPELVVVGGSLGRLGVAGRRRPRLDRPLRPARHRGRGPGRRRRARRPRRGGRRGRARDRPGRCA